MVIDGRITIGTYLAYTGIVIWLIWPMRNLGRLIVQTSTGLVSYGRVMEIIKQNREPLDEGSVLLDQSPTGDITFDNVGFEYEEGIPTLRSDYIRMQIRTVGRPSGSHRFWEIKPGKPVATFL